MKLILLEPNFLKIETTASYKQIDDLTQAQGILFLCPKCYVNNGNSAIGTHSVICWFANKNVPDELTPKPGRWAASGAGYNTLTLNPSIQLNSGCCWHGYIINGEAS